MVLGSTWLESFQYYPIVMLFVSIGLELCDYWLMVIHLEILDEITISTERICHFIFNRQSPLV